MALDLKQSLKLTHQLLMTPQLQQAIRLLQLSRIELEEFVSQQISENPTLEDVSQEFVDKSEKQKKEVSGEGSVQAQPEKEERAAENTGEYEWDYRSKAEDLSSRVYQSSREESVNYENFVTKAKTLQEHLLSQVGELGFSEAENEIALKLIGNITDQGYLDLDIVKLAGEEELDLDVVEGVLDTIQRLEPSGVGARSLSECLLIQIRDGGLKNGIIEKIVEHHLKDLESKSYRQIARKLKIPLKEVLKNIGIIAGLNPVPGRKFGEGVNLYVIPDVFVFKVGKKWLISLNEDNLPKLRVSKYYQDIAGTLARGKEKGYIVEKIKSASWLIKSLQQRQRTIKKVSECIVEKQGEFLEKGILFLKPMVLRDVAEAIEMHESTVSRVTSNKYIQTPQGIFELKFFFSSSIKSHEEDLSSSSVKAMIKEIVGGEDPRKPLSDQKIVSLLDEKGVHLARRTVAKYREQIGIMTSSRRKKFF